LRGQLKDREAQALADGIELEDGRTLPTTLEIVTRNKTYTDVEITLVEGRNRQIRRMFAHLGYPIVRLVRLAIGGLQLGHAAPGSWRFLTGQEVSDLLTQTEK
jgi:pseudouridine synthase